jgi:ferredoxin
MEVRVKVWIDPVECMGAGTCEQIAPDVFTSSGDGTWVVKEDGGWFGATTVFDGANAPGHGPSGAVGVARVPDELADWVMDAAEQCPAECIYLEP